MTSRNDTRLSLSSWPAVPAAVRATLRTLAEEHRSDSADAWLPMVAPWAPREAHVWYLEITYPAGSRAPGWRPASWSDSEFLARLSRKARRQLRKAEFRWPRERLFLSSSGAYDRAWLLRAYGAKVTVYRSFMVLWPGTDDGEIEFDITGLLTGTGRTS
jgi:hypothetical protein